MNCRIVIAAACMSLATAQLPGQEPGADSVRIRIEPDKSLGRISEDFMGFGYETSAVAQSNFFSPKNLAMARLYRNLSPHGLIRIGGIISDHTKYVPDGATVAQTQTGTTVINQASLVDLSAFAQATGWKVMWGLNLGTGSQAEAIQEAVAVTAALGAHLQSFEIGNEVENLRHGYAAYFSDYVDYKKGIRAVLPDAPFSGPDSVGNWAYATNFAATEDRDIKFLTHHYYRGGAGDKKTSLERLLQHDQGWDKRLQSLQELGRDHGLAYRINEVNSFSGGGKPGVSDVFGSALWCLDYLFTLAAHGCEGVNMETDINQLGFISHYSPIAHDRAGRCSVRPEYYGMLAFALAGHGELFAVTMEKTELNLSAYAAKNEDGSFWITIVNKDFTGDAAVVLVLPGGYSGASVVRLTAPSMSSKEHVSLAGAEVAADGAWAAGPMEKVVVQDRAARVLIPHASAALVRARRD